MVNWAVAYAFITSLYYTLCVLCIYVYVYSDGSAVFGIDAYFDVYNGNFLATGIDEIQFTVLHNNSVLGSTMLNTTRFAARTHSLLHFPLLFDPCPPNVISSILSDLRVNNGIVQFQFFSDITTNEVFRLRYLTVNCLHYTKWNPLPVPPTTNTMLQTCDHQLKTG